MAWFALFSWPVLATVFYQRFSLQAALCATLLGGYLLLPNRVAWNLPFLPLLNKQTIPTIAAILLTMIFVAKAARAWNRTDQGVLPGWMPREMVTRILLVLFVVSFFASALTNGDTRIYGPRAIPGLSLYDAVSQLMEFTLVIAPFFLGRKLLSSPQGQRTLLYALAFSGLAYSLLMLYEARMSPQIHMMVYGFFPHSFAQHMRSGGFRPVVFLNHGLALAIYMLFSLLAVAGLYRMAQGQNRLKWVFAMAWMCFAVLLAKSLGTLMIAVVLVPIALFLTPRLQALLAACIMAIVLTYPMLRAADLVPVNAVMNLAEQINPARADSLQIRISNERALLDKAGERPLFGWGGWGRNRIFDENGNNLSITDGEWIIVLGVGGWLRYISLFGLMCWPVILMYLRHRDKVGLPQTILALILCAKLVDMLPNSGWLAVPWLIAGSLVGFMERRNVPQDDSSQVAGAGGSPPDYARAKGPTQAPADGPRYARVFEKRAQPDDASPPSRKSRNTTRNKRFGPPSESHQ